MLKELLDDVWRDVLEVRVTTARIESEWKGSVHVEGGCDIGEQVDSE